MTDHAYEEFLAEHYAERAAQCKQGQHNWTRVYGDNEPHCSNCHIDLFEYVKVN